MIAGRRVLLLIPARSYRAADFMRAAATMGLDLTVASDGALPVGGGQVIPVHSVHLEDLNRSVERIASHIASLDASLDASLVASRGGPVDAVVAADAPMLPLAAAVAARLGLPHNPVDAVLAASDKARQRQRWAAAGVAQPRFAIVPADAADLDIRRAAATAGFPCVVKATSLSASQGVLRADTPAQAVTAATRIRRVLAAAGRPPARRVRPLPDGDEYLGFVFAEAATPDEVEKALTTASQRLRAVIE